MDVKAEIWFYARLLLLFAGLLLPGSAIMRALRVPANLTHSFVGSALSIYVAVLALQFSGERISLLSLSIALAVITVAGHLIASRSDVSGFSGSSLSRFRTHNPITGMGPWTPVYLMFAAVVVWRAWQSPLAGPDIEFRWSFLAEQMLRRGSLYFYPPETAEDFFSYFWVESIPPGASALHAWAYACAGETKAAWTIPAVVLQLWTVHELLWRASERIGNIQTSRFTCLAVAACPLLTWSILIGQETGLTAIAMIGILYSLHVWSETRAGGWAALAGIFAAVGASAREYGVIFPLLAATGMMMVRANARAWLAFLGFAVIALMWPVRTWLLTGNPFYSLPVGGLFPINSRFVAWIEYDANAFGDILHTVGGWGNIGRYLLLYAPLALLGWGVIAATAFRRARLHAKIGLALIAVLLGIWALSVRYTNGGAFYSLRVTSPALALGGLGAGAGLAAFVSRYPNKRISTMVTVSLLVLATLPATLALPSNPLRTPWREWPTFASRHPPATATDETVTVILRAMAASGRSRAETIVLADSPGFQRRFQPSGVRVVPLWSPQADWLFDLRRPAGEALTRWRASGIHYIVVTKWRANLDFFNQRSRWASAPFQVQQIGETPLTAIFSIRPRP